MGLAGVPESVVQRDIHVSPAEEHMCGGGVGHVEQRVRGESPDGVGAGELGVRVERSGSGFIEDGGGDWVDGE